MVQTRNSPGTGSPRTFWAACETRDADYEFIYFKQRGGALQALFFFGIIGVIAVFSIGLSYRGLRFMANYEISQVVVTDCESEFVEGGHEESPSYFTFILRVDGLAYPLTLTEDFEISFWDAIRLRDPAPGRDWCELVGTTVDVAHYDKLQVAVLLLGTEPPSKLGLYTRVLKMETYGAVWIVPILAVGILLLVGFGGMVALGKAFFRLEFRAERESGDSSLRYAMKNFNHVSGLIASLVLGSLLAIGLGVALVKGMLYVESASSFYSGIIVLLGALIAAFGPALILTVVLWVRTTESEYVQAIRTVVTIAAMIRVSYTTWRFAITTDFKSLNLETSGDLIREILLSVVS